MVEAVLLIISIVSQSPETTEEQIEPSAQDLMLMAPVLPPWPPGLSPVEIQVDGSLCMRADTTDAVHDRLLYLDIYPQLCQQTLQEQAGLAYQVLSGMAQACEDQCKLEVIKHDQSIERGWPDWAMWLVGVGSLAVGAGLGALIMGTAR